MVRVVVNTSLGRDACRVIDKGLWETVMNGLGARIALLNDGFGVGSYMPPDGSGVTLLYYRKRGYDIDIGTRLDFTEHGWADICDQVDRDCLPEGWPPRQS
jgi:hypothetical protein